MREVVLSTAVLASFKREVTVLLRRRSEIVNPLLFLLVVCSLFPLGVSPAPAVLQMLAPGIIWVVALLACLLSTEAMFRSDFDDGSVELFLLAPQPLYFHVLAKAVAHWLLTGIPLTIFSPVIAVLLNLQAHALPVLMLSLLLGTGVLTMLGAIGAALTVGLRRGGVLLSLVVLPLYTPVLIFGSDAVKQVAEGGAAGGQLAVIGAFFVLSIALSPLAIAGALRISVDN